MTIVIQKHGLTNLDTPFHSADSLLTRHGKVLLLKSVSPKNVCLLR